MFEPITINGVTFKNRLIRSSIGGRTAYYEGYVNEAWKHFEVMFAKHGIGAIVSATMTVSNDRWAPMEYPKIAGPQFIPPLRDGVKAVQSFGCKYILQIGDPGYHVQTALFAKPQDTRSSSPGFDFIYGYQSRRTEMTIEHIQDVVQHFANSATYVREAGCDGLEVTASKGYLIHQFLNPGINRRKDEYGGSLENRFRFLADIVRAIRTAIGRDFLFGIRISANDFNYLPLNFRTPISSNWTGNTIHDMLQVGQWLKELGVDYLHVSNGFGFINPKENPGEWPLDAVRMFANSTRHLSTKAWLRSTVLNSPLGHFTGIGWTKPPLGKNAGPPPNLADAHQFKEEVGLPVIANGGFHRRHQIEDALASGGCDFVSMARGLLANMDLPELFAQGLDGADEAPPQHGSFSTPRSDCTYCNRCAVYTTVLPIGCYDPSRFSGREEMEESIREVCGRPFFATALAQEVDHRLQPQAALIQEQQELAGKAAELFAHQRTIMEAEVQYLNRIEFRPDEPVGGITPDGEKSAAAGDD
jgi:2,4-dienoyl-CoA reductase-like NADH-dependent reductase (Old Yellow Enzyme family)